MKVYSKTILGLILSIVFLPLIAFAQSPGIPHKFYGTVTMENGVAPNGLTVEAEIGGEIFGTSITNNDGKYGYSDLMIVTDPRGNNNGEEIKFYVSGIETEETAIFENGASSEINLTVPGEAGIITNNEDETIENKTVAVSSNQSASIEMGDSLNVIVSSAKSTNATINRVEKLENNFYDGATAVMSGNEVLNGFEIDIDGENLVISASMKYDDSNIDEDTIKPYKFDSASNSWVEITSNVNVDKSSNEVTFEIKIASTPYVLFAEPVSTETSSPSGGGGGGGSFTVQDDNEEEDESERADIDGDGNVGLFDFNQLMVQWGNYGSDYEADINEDNEVDILDFNSLMVYWTE